ncbi:hypothetical protein GTW56_28085 [Bacillus sp. EB93]|nr:hypothetical protein [Peribacillus frigoritolerans]
MKFFKNCFLAAKRRFKDIKYNYYYVKFKEWLHYNKEHIIMLFVVTTTIFIWGYAQTILISGPKDSAFWLSIIPNPVMSMLGILISTYFVSNLVTSSQGKKQKKVLAEIFDSSLDKLSESIMIDFIFFLTYGEEWKKIIGNRENLERYLCELANDSSSLVTYQYVMGDVSVNLHGIEHLEDCFLKDWEEVKEAMKSKYIYYFDQIAAHVGTSPKEYSSFLETPKSVIQQDHIKVERIRYIDELVIVTETKIKKFYNEYEFILPIEIKRALQSIKNKLIEQKNIYRKIEMYKLVDSENSKEQTPLLHKEIVSLSEKTADEVLYLLKYFRI